MCIQDWQIGRLIRSQVSRKIIGTSATKILERNKNRVAITFVGASNSVMSLLTDPGVTAVSGFALLPASNVSTGGFTVAETATGSEIDLVLTSSNTVLSANYTGDPIHPVYDIAGTLTGSLTSNSDRPYLHFTLKDYGDLPMQWWYGIAATVEDIITVIEYILPDGVLAMTPDELRKAAI